MVMRRVARVWCRVVGHLVNAMPRAYKGARWPRHYQQCSRCGKDLGIWLGTVGLPEEMSW